MAVPELSFAQLRARWQSLLESRFCQEDFVEFLVGVRTDLPVGSFMRQVAEVMVAELDPDIPVQPLVMEDITTWPMTTRIDGIMPLKIPVSNDVVLPIYRFPMHYLLELSMKTLVAIYHLDLLQQSI